MLYVSLKTSSWIPTMDCRLHEYRMTGLLVRTLYGYSVSPERPRSMRMVVVNSTDKLGLNQFVYADVHVFMFNFSHRVPTPKRLAERRFVFSVNMIMVTTTTTTTTIMMMMMTMVMMMVVLMVMVKVVVVMGMVMVMATMTMLKMLMIMIMISNI